MIVFMHCVWLDIKPWEWALKRKNKSRKKQSPRIDPPISQERDFIGKSLVRMSAKMTNAASATPNVPQAEEGEEVDEKDVTFAPPKQENGLRQMTPEEEEEAFKSFRYSKEEDAEETTAENYAEGYTYEDMVEAILNVLEKNQADFSKRVRSIIEKYKSQDGGNTASEEETPDNGRKPFKLPENPTEFNIRDFI